jgi:hypothetical protein
MNLAVERPEIEYFFSRWPALYKGYLARNGFEVLRDIVWLGHRIITSRAVS